MVAKQKLIKVEIEILGTKQTEKDINGCLIETLDKDFLENGEKVVSFKIIKKIPNYEQGFNILMEYFDSIADEEKPKVNKRLKRLGL